jgi:hypothetical protein
MFLKCIFRHPACSARGVFYICGMTAPELKEWFAGKELPVGPIWIHKSLKVEEPKLFLQLHFYSIESTSNERANEPLIIRLELMKKWMEENGHA